MRCQTQSQSTAHCMKVRADRLPLQLISLVLNEYNRHENMAAPYVNKLGVLKKLNAHWLGLGPKKRIYAHTPTRTTQEKRTLSGRCPNKLVSTISTIELFNLYFIPFFYTSCYPIEKCTNTGCGEPGARLVCGPSIS